MKTNLNTAILFMFLFLFMACKKSDTATPAAQKTLLSKADFSPAGGIHTYTYDAAGNMLTEVSTAGTSGVAFTTTFTNYDVMGRVTEYITDYVSAAYTDIKTVVSFNASGKIDKILDFQLNGGALDDYYTFEYPAGKQIRKYYTNANVLSGIAENTFSADGKNRIETKNFNNPSNLSVLSNTQAYSNFDTKKTRDLLFPYGYSLVEASENNFQTLTSTNNITNVVTTTTYTYEYNSDGYFTKRTSSTGAVSLYEYIKK
jgi:YD repeat-containing protein